MSDLSNNQGRAYEFICLNALYDEISKFRKVQIIENSSFKAAQKAFDTLTSVEKTLYHQSALAMIPSIFDCEPRIIEQDDDIIELFIQKDEAGKDGDVRDIIIVRNDIQWEIGLSIKHNHFAVKHSRLSHSIDFGDKWYGVPCSQQYWADIKPIFDYLEKEKNKNTKFSELPDKENDVYKPLVQAFIDEINRQYESNPTIPKKLVEYLLSKFDFYKVISIDAKRETQIQSYNIHGTLNAPAKNAKPKIQIPVAALPKRIIKLDFMPERSNTAELYLDGGWYFTFRIHNAETYVKPTLKFDIQLAGLPATIITINCIWN
ncbi:MAG: HaeIII family restriction endonuclease [Bacteroidales bacterium]|nr:HaeIII family restriction endonuclease [Bacteroidales bacterium]